MFNRHTVRLKGYDYSQNGYYFVTVCAQNRENLFGKIIDKKIKLNDMGNMIYTQWNELINRFHNIELDEFVVMPNHVHGIIVIRNNIMVRNDVGAGFPRPSLGQIIAFFKYKSTKQIRIAQTGAETAPLQKQISIPKIWQRNFYEHIIRNETEYYKIKEYILMNPMMWERDRNNPKKICTGGVHPAQ